MFFLHIIVFATVMNTSECFECDSKNTAGECVCEPHYSGAYHVYCPTRVMLRRRGAEIKRLEIVWHQEYHRNWNYLEISCSKDITSKDILPYLKGLAFDRIDKLSIKKCPALDASFINTMNASSASQIIFSQTRQEKNETWNSFAGTENLTKLDIIYQEHLVLGQDSLEHNRQLKHLSLRGNKDIVLHHQVFFKSA